LALCEFTEQEHAGSDDKNLIEDEDNEEVRVDDSTSNKGPFVCTPGEMAATSTQQVWGQD